MMTQPSMKAASTLNLDETLAREIVASPSAAAGEGQQACSQYLGTGQSVKQPSSDPAMLNTHIFMAAVFVVVLFLASLLCGFVLQPMLSSLVSGE